MWVEACNKTSTFVSQPLRMKFKKAHLSQLKMAIGFSMGWQLTYSWALLIHALLMSKVKNGFRPN